MDSNTHYKFLKNTLKQKYIQIIAKQQLAQHLTGNKDERITAEWFGYLSAAIDILEIDYGRLKAMSIIADWMSEVEEKEGAVLE